METSKTPFVPEEERPTKYLEVSAYMKENRETYKRRIKLILVDHYLSKGIPYVDDHKIEGDSDDEEDDMIYQDH